jgi:hypothetical protein
MDIHWANMEEYEQGKRGRTCTGQTWKDMHRTNMEGYANGKGKQNAGIHN